MKHRYLFTYTANTLDGRGVFSGHATVTLSAPFAPENVTEVCEVLRTSCPERVTSPTLTSVWKFEV